MDDPNLTPVEVVKARSNFLRGTIVDGLGELASGAIADDDTNLTKFHGIYQQDDRDLRAERRKQKLEPAYSFMVRVRVPGGVCSAEQWLVLDKLARKYGGDTLRLTTRQAVQFHGVIKRQLKATIVEINQALLDTIAACGDVNRNVMCSPNPELSTLHRDVFEFANDVSAQLTPRTRAYHEIWLENEKVVGIDDEPLYGPTYLPRKFKLAFAIPPNNDVDVFAHDLGFIAIAEGQRLQGFNVTVGGGMGMTHGEVGTYPRLADVIGFCHPSQVLNVAEQVVTIQRDFGDRGNRKHARLKYTIDERGLEWFKQELVRRLGWQLGAAVPYQFRTRGDRFGWLQAGQENWHRIVFIENGRIKDTADRSLMTALATIAAQHDGDIRLTPNQNLLLANVSTASKPVIDALLHKHGVIEGQTASPLRRNSMACVALPTCGLAMAEAERYLPELITSIDQLLAQHGVSEEPIVIRMTGCPNGCARPFVAEIGLVGKAPGRYNLYLGASHTGERLNALYRENITESQILVALDLLIGRYAAERRSGERFGDFVVRVGEIGRVVLGKDFHRYAAAGAAR